LAWEQKAQGIECDVHLSADGVLVCHHDATTKRIFGKRLAIAKSSWRDLRQLTRPGRLERGTEANIPRLEEVLEAAPGDSEVFVEIKAGLEAVPVLLNTLDEGARSDIQVTVISFCEKALEALHRERSKLRLYWLCDFSGKRGKDWEESLMRKAREMGVAGLGLKAGPFVTESLARRRFSEGLELNVWTVDAINAAKRYAQMGVQSITTNWPLKIARALR